MSMSMIFGPILTLILGNCIFYLRTFCRLLVLYPELLYGDNALVTEHNSVRYNCLLLIINAIIRDR